MVEEVLGLLKYFCPPLAGLRPLEGFLLPPAPLVGLVPGVLWASFLTMYLISWGGVGVRNQSNSSSPS